MPNPILTMAALEYMKAGLHVLALTGKKPNGRVHGEAWSWEDSFHGFPENTDEFDAVEDAFSKERGTTGIAILVPPDFLVADVDSDRAAELLVSLGFQATDDTIVAQTKNGLHLWFWWPGADRNRWVGDGQEPNPGRTLLFKGFGGYVVAPPSLHFAADGTVDGTYSWGPSLIRGGAIFMPDILPEGVRARFKRDDLWAGDRSAHQPSVATFTVTPVDGLQWWQWPKVWDYNLTGLEKAIESAADGNQNNIIHWAALTARDEGVPYEVSMTRLLDAAIRGGHPANRARDTIRGAYKRAPRG
jgi:hypothetical protein